MPGPHASRLLPLNLPFVGRGLDPSAPCLPCQREVAPQRRRDSCRCRLLSFNPPVGAGHARPARFRKLLCQLRQTILPPTTPATSTSRPRGISRALKTARGAAFAPRYAGRGAATCGYRIRLRPLGGACLLRPLRLLRLPVSAAGGGRLRSRLFESRTGHLLRPTPIKKRILRKKHYLK